MKKELLEKLINSKKNLIVSGDVSSGKTSNVMFPLVKEKIEQKQSLVILDAKEEYLNKFYDDLKKNDYNIVILNLKDLNKSEGWNPLEYPYNLYKSGKIDEAVDYISKQSKILVGENSIPDPFWTNSAADFYTGVVLGLFEDGKEEEINLNSVNLMFNEIDKKYAVSDYITEYFKFKDPSSLSYVFASTTFLAPKETKGGIVSTARQNLRTCVSREMLSVLLSKTTFDINSILTKPVVFFVIAKEENRNVNKIANMFIDQLFTILINSEVKNKFNFILDNFDVLEKIIDLNDMLSAGIPKNIMFYIATRSFDDLIKKYENYITKLSNIVNIDKDNLIINNEKCNDSLEYLIEPNIEVNVEFPILKACRINTFNLEDFVCNRKKDIAISDKTNPINASNNAIDKMLIELEKKIEELEVEEKKETEVENTNIKSDFSQFKI